jgi:hypothetical protein
MGKRTRPVKFDAKLEAALNATGLPWHIEPGSKHFQIRLSGRLAGIIPQGVKGDNSRVMTSKNIKNVNILAARLKAGENSC